MEPAPGGLRKRIDSHSHFPGAQAAWLRAAAPPGAQSIGATIVSTLPRARAMGHRLLFMCGRIELFRPVPSLKD